MKKVNKKSLLEIYLFIRPFKLSELKNLLNMNEKEINNLVKEINEELKERPYKIYIEEDFLYFGPKEEYQEFVKDFLKPLLDEKEIKILSMIVNNFSYSDIIKKFGKKGKEILEKLEKEGWIRIKKENKKYKFSLTSKFKKYFAIK